MKKIVIIVSVFLYINMQASIQHIVRYEYKENINYGLLKDQTIQPLKGNIYNKIVLNGVVISLKEVNLLLPVKAQKVFAVGMNFASHLSSPSNAAPPLFLKLPSSLIKSGDTINLPSDSTNVHFEGELVLVIGKKAKNITEDKAKTVIFGVTTGNDLTERNWQSSDLQWMRSKASDGFGPIAPTIAIGVDYNNVLLTTKLNGKIVQQENTKYMIHKPEKVVSYLSRYFTLMPGDLIFMGTPGRTQALYDGDIVSVHIQNVGYVENKIRKNQD